MNTPEELDKAPEELERLREILKKHRVARVVSKAIYRMVVRILAGNAFNGPGGMGLLEGSIINNPLSCPSDEGEWIAREQAPGGSWVAYDFQRPETFAGYDRRPFFKGRLIAFVLDEIKNNPSEERTPLGLFRLNNFDQVLQLNTYTAAELTDNGLLQLTSYGKAYETVGLYDQYADELRMRSVIDDPVFQVTPKGNTLIILAESGGDPTPKEAREPSLAWLPGMRPALVPVPVPISRAV